MLKVSSGSNPHAVAGAIAAALRDAGAAEAHAIGAGAVNQAVKAIAIARDYLRGQGFDCTCLPSFVEVDVEGATRTAIRLQVEIRTTAAAAARPGSLGDGPGLDAPGLDGPGPQGTVPDPVGRDEESVALTAPPPALDGRPPIGPQPDRGRVIVLDDAEALAPTTPPGL